MTERGSLPVTGKENAAELTTTIAGTATAIVTIADVATVMTKITTAKSARNYNPRGNWRDLRGFLDSSFAEYNSRSAASSKSCTDAPLSG